MANREELEVAIRGKDEFSAEFKRIESSIIRTVGTISAALAGIKIGIAPIKAASGFERALADVAKTTDFTSKAIQGSIGTLDTLGSSLLKLSLNLDVTATDLAKIAAAAGQQGLGRFGVQGIVQFTESVARMASVLDIAAEDAANQTGKIINIFKIPLSEVERAISVINQVSNQSTASGEELLDVIKRIGDASGALTLQQSSALAATGIDFGQAPEVVGTAFARVFSAAFEKADQFGALMNISATEWVNRLKTDGVRGFKDFLASLRKLDAQSQQAAIVKLVGGGRIGALLNKLIQDTTDSVLNRNLESAVQGSSGTSALREQANVLNTLDAQAKILGNSFVKLGIEVSQQLLAPLTQYAAQLSGALQEPQVKSFFSAVFQAVGQTVGVVVNLVKAVAGLNVNWENFILVVKFFVGLKLAQAIGNAAAGFSVFGKSLKSISANAEAAALANDKLATSSKAAAAAQATAAASEASGAGKASLLARIVGYTDLEKRVREYRAAVQAAAAAETELKAAQNIAVKATNNVNAASAAAGSAGTAVATAAGAAARQREALRRAEDAAQAASIAAQQSLANRLVQAEAANAAARAAIETDYQTRRAAITATGTQTGLKALRAERLALLETQESGHQRSLRGIETYYARRAATQQAALAAEVQRERAALIATLGVFDDRVNEQFARQQTLGAAAGAKTASDAALVGATGKLTLLEKAQRAAGAAGLFLAGALKAIGTVASRLLGAFAWVTILYSIADALGIIDKVAPTFQRLTDAIGLTSKATRDKAVEDAKEVEDAKKFTAALEEQTAAYEKNLDAQTGRQNIANVDKLVQSSQATPDTELQQKNTEQLAQLLLGAQKGAEAAAETSKKTTDLLIKEQEAKIDQANANILRKQGELQRALAQAPKSFQPSLIENSKKQIDEQKAIIEAAKKALETYGGSLEQNKAKQEAFKKGAEDIGNAIAGAFTPESRAALEEFILPIKAGEAEIKRLGKVREEELTKAAQSKTLTADTGSLVLAQMDGIQRKNDATLNAFRALIEDQKKLGVSAESLKSFEALFLILKLSSEHAFAIGNGIKAIPETKLTGTLIPGTKPAATGTNTFNGEAGRGEESLARRTARARLALERAEIQAANALKDEASKQALEIEQRQFDQGLVAIKAFYAERARIQKQALADDIADKRLEQKAIDFEAEKLRKDTKNTKKNAPEILKFDAESVRVQGQIAVLQARRDAIDAETQDEVRKKSEDFTNRIRSETNQLFDQGVLPADAPIVFQSNLDGLLAQYQTFLNQLDSEGNGALTDALVKSFQIDSFKKAIAPATAEIGLIFDQLGRVQSQIAAARANNSVTTVQADILATQAIRERLPLLEEQLRIQERTLAQVALGAGVGSLAYRQQAEAVDVVRQRLVDLANQTDTTAKSVNQSMTSSLAGALDKLTDYGSSLKDVFKALIFDISNQIKKLFAQDIAEGLTKAAGGTGAGGFGGFIQKALSGSPFKGTTGVQPGATAANPLYVSDVNPAAAVSGEGTLADSLSQLGEKISSFFTDAFSSIKSALGFADTAKTAVTAVDTAKTATDVAGATTETTGAATAAAFSTALGIATTIVSGFSLTLQTVIGPLAGGLAGVGLALSTSGPLIGTLPAQVTLLQGALNTLIAALNAAAARASFAHTGGIVGKTPLRRGSVSSLAFVGARRYHGGGIAGLSSKEVPAILQKGEAVLTENQQSLVAAALSPTQSTGETNIRNVLVTDSNFIPDGMASSQGERVVMTHIKTNRVGIRQLLGV